MINICTNCKRLWVVHTIDDNFLTGGLNLHGHADCKIYVLFNCNLTIQHNKVLHFTIYFLHFYNQFLFWMWWFDDENEVGLGTCWTRAASFLSRLASASRDCREEGPSFPVVLTVETGCPMCTFAKWSTLRHTAISPRHLSE